MLCKNMPMENVMQNSTQSKIRTKVCICEQWLESNMLKIKNCPGKVVGEMSTCSFLSFLFFFKLNIATPPPTTHFQKTSFFFMATDSNGCLPNKSPLAGCTTGSSQEGQHLPGYRKESDWKSQTAQSSSLQLTQSKLRELKASWPRQFWKSFSFLIVKGCS